MTRPMTITEKILAAHAGLDEVEPGQLINCRLDLVLANDVTAPIAIKEFRKIGVDCVWDPERIALVPDHYTPNKDIKSAEQAKMMRDFAREQGITHYYEIGCMGVEHALLPEQGVVGPGDCIIGAMGDWGFSLPNMDMGNSSFGRCGAGVLIHPAANIQQPLANVNQSRAVRHNAHGRPYLRPWLVPSRLVRRSRWQRAARDSANRAAPAGQRAALRPRLRRCHPIGWLPTQSNRAIRPDVQYSSEN